MDEPQNYFLQKILKSFFNASMNVENFQKKLLQNKIKFMQKMINCHKGQRHKTPLNPIYKLSLISHIKYKNSCRENFPIK